MSATSDQLPDGTLVFLPNRLNRQPIIVLGMTADELWLSVGLSAVAGLVTGVCLAMLTQSIAMVPSIVLGAVSMGIFVGGKFLRRLKRGKPQTWLYRQMQFRVSKRLPAVSAWTGGRDLVIRSGRWETRRSAKR